MRSSTSPGPAALARIQGSNYACIELHADVHLQAQEPATFALWQSYIESSAADCLIILGDLFEVWVGDDWGLSDPFALQCAAVLHAASQHKDIYYLHGNRDFLLGAAYAAACGMQLLTEPCVLDLGHEQILLSHGDAWVTSDVAYQNFRHMVRQPQWQADFLAQPLAARLQLAANIRAQSQAAQAGRTHYDDINPLPALAAMQAASAQTLIHGHTHRPSHDELDSSHTRWVLSDWDANAGRGDVLRLQTSPQGLGIERIQMRSSNHNDSNSDNNSALIAASQARLKNVTDALITADCQGKICGWNASAQALFGFSAAQALGQSLDLIIPEHLRDAHWAGFYRAIANKDISHHGPARKTRALHQSGDKRYVMMRFDLVRNAGGEVLGAMALAQAVSSN